jgi:hypothetical protein
VKSDRPRFPAFVVELIAMSGLAVYANIMADSTAVEADAMFETVGARARDDSIPGHDSVEPCDFSPIE